MTYETYENLKRANARRKRHATYVGNWKEVSRCSEEDQRLDAEYRRSANSNPERHAHNAPAHRSFGEADGCDNSNSKTGD